LIRFVEFPSCPIPDLVSYREEMYSNLGWPVSSWESIDHSSRIYIAEDNSGVIVGTIRVTVFDSLVVLSRLISSSSHVFLNLISSSISDLGDDVNCVVVEVSEESSEMYSRLGLDVAIGPFFTDRYGANDVLLVGEVGNDRFINFMEKIRGHFGVFHE